MKTVNLTDVIQLGRFAGSRFDLVQAGGGNVSWKDPQDQLWVKTSGISMSEIESSDAFATLQLSNVYAILSDPVIIHETNKKSREQKAAAEISKFNLSPQNRPSIEAFLHTMLYPFTLHTHPIAVNHLVICKEAKEMLLQLFPQSVFVEYATPGIDLAIKMKNAIDCYQQQTRRQPNIVFLKNHGLIVSATTADEVREITQQVVETIEHYLHIDYSHYHTTSVIANLFWELTGSYPAVVLSEDQQIRDIWQKAPQLLRIAPTSPDAFVFNGFLPCHLSNLNLIELRSYIEQYGAPPKNLIYNNNLYFVHRSVRKAREMEEVFKFHLMALYHATGMIESLSHEEFLYLASWEAEKYRQQR